MSLTNEIQQLLASFSIPEDIAGKIAASHEEVEDSSIAPGIAVGEAAPDFQLEDSRGAVIQLSERLLRGPVVVSFFRGAWCPVCNLQLAAFQRVLPEILDLNGEILAIHPDTGQLIEDPPEGFSILSDPSQRVIRDYKLQFALTPEIQRIYPLAFGVDVSTRNANGSWNLPVPGTFIVNQQGLIAHRHVRADFGLRMEPTEVVEALRALR